jgi:hypothetical protein
VVLVGAAGIRVGDEEDLVVEHHRVARGGFALKGLTRPTAKAVMKARSGSTPAV